MQFLAIKIKLFLRLMTNQAMINYPSTGVSAAAKNLYLSFYSLKLLHYKTRKEREVGEPNIFYEQKSNETIE